MVLDPERGRVGGSDREAVVRIFREYEFRSLIDRLPPLTGERPEDAVLAMRGLRGRRVPAAQGAGRGRAGAAGSSRGFAGPGGAGGHAAGRPNDGSLQLSMDFDVVSGGGGAGGGGGGGSGSSAPIAATSSAVEARAEALAAATGDLPGALAAAIVNPGRIEVADKARIATLEPWLRGQAAVGVALVVDDPRPLAGTPLAIAVAGADGRVVAADGATGWIALRASPERLGTPLVGHEVKPLLAARFAEEPGAVPTPVAFDTRSRPTSSTPRSGPEDRRRRGGASSTSSCRLRPRASPPPPSPASRRSPSSPSGHPWSRPSATRPPNGCSSRSSSRWSRSSRGWRRRGRPGPGCAVRP